MPCLTNLAGAGEHDDRARAHRWPDDRSNQVRVSHAAAICTGGRRCCAACILSMSRKTAHVIALCRYDFASWFGTKVQLQMAPESGMSQAMADLEFKARCRDRLNVCCRANSCRRSSDLRCLGLQGSDWNSQLKLGSNQFYGARYALPLPAAASGADRPSTAAACPP